MSVCDSVCLSVNRFVCLSNTITPEPLEISSRNFPGVILRSKGKAKFENCYRGVRGLWIANESERIEAYDNGAI